VIREYIILSRKERKKDRQTKGKKDRRKEGRKEG